MPSRYGFTNYSPHWPQEFDRVAAQLRTLLGDKLIAVHHIGSTSVPGLAAKPIIDVLPIVKQIERMDLLTPQFQTAGFQIWGEYGLPGRRFFTKDNNGERTHNVHVYGQGNDHIERHLAFCAYLRRHDAVCREYETLKRKVYAQHPADITAYNDGKNNWIKSIEPLAVAWYRQQNSTPI